MKLRIKEVVDALSTKPKPRQETSNVFQTWGVQQVIKKHRGPLPKLIEELNEKITAAIKKLQQKLSDTAQRPDVLSDSAEQPVPMDTSADVDLGQNPALAELRARQKKITQASAVEERVLPFLSEQSPCGAEQPALKKPALDVTANTKQEAKSSDLA